MKCPKCGNDNVNVQIVTEGTRTKKKGCLYSIGRLLLIVCTCGLWLVFGKKKEKSKNINSKKAVCQSCGYSWNV